MDKVKWCLNQKKGLSLIDPNDNLSKEYYSEALETLQELEDVKGKWKVIMAYYSCYNALYSVLMKIGIKCEIHDCSIEMSKLIEGFNEEDYEFLSELKDKRIKVQYYLKKEELQKLDEVKTFVWKVKEVLNDLDVVGIRNKLK